MSRDIQTLETHARSIPGQVQKLTISTNAEYLDACELAKTIKLLRAEIDATFDPVIQKAYAAHKEAVATKRKFDGPLNDAEAIVKARIGHWLEERERKDQEEELRLQKLAQDAEEQRQLEAAAMLDDLGETAEANKLLEETVLAPPVILAPSTPKVAGVSMTARYSAEVTNLLELVKAVAAGKAPLQCLKADTVFLNAQARAMRQALSYPGVRLRVENSVGVRK